MVECPSCSRGLRKLDNPIKRRGVLYLFSCVCCGGGLFTQGTYDRQKKWEEIKGLRLDELLNRIKSRRVTEGI